MGKEELSTPGSLVKKSNSIIRTRLTVKSVEASRILAHLIACIHTEDTTLEQTYRVPAKDILLTLVAETTAYQSHLPRTGCRFR